MSVTGWELRVERLGQHKSGNRVRTYGRYQVYLDDVPIEALAGNVCEAAGPGDNSKANNGRRIAAGRYPLWTQFGAYRSIGYSTNQQVPGEQPMPAVLLQGTDKRSGILVHPAHPPTLYLSSIGCFNPTNPLQPNQEMNYWDSRSRVIALIESLKAHAPAAFAHEISSRIANAWVVVEGEPTHFLDAAPVPALAPKPAALLAAAPGAPTPEPANLPLTRASAIKCASWLMGNYGDKIRAAVVGKPYGAKHLCAIVCQETAYKWLKWIDTMSPDAILAACVFDASGDYPDTSRSAFPVNTAAFRAAYGDAFTDMLIEEANKTRRLQGWSDKPWVYKGYGLFQYDLQYVKSDRVFFENRLWRDFDECLARCCRELDKKLIAVGGELWKAIKAYNGSGARATQYAANVKVFTEYCATVTGG